MSVNDCGCTSAVNSTAIYNQREDWLNRNRSSGNYATPTYGYDPGLSFNGSVFDFDNSTFANTYSGLNCLGGYNFGYGMPYGGGYGMGMYGNADSYWDYMDRYSDRAMAYNRHRIEKQREDEMYINGPSDTIAGKVALLQRAIQKNDQTHIDIAFKNYMQAVAEMYPNYDGNSLPSRALAIYKEITGTTLLADLTTHGHGMFTQKFINAATLGIGAKYSAEENIARLTGQPMSERDNLYGAAGTIAGVGTAGTGIYLAGRTVVKNWSGITKAISKHPVGAIVAGAITAVALIFGISGYHKRGKVQKNQ